MTLQKGWKMNNMLNFIINYWFLIVLFVAIAALFGGFISNFLQKSTEEKLQSVKEWAIYACAIAQAHLGSGTGQLKMRETYDMFIIRFPDLAKIISYETYKFTAELALAEFKKMLETNPNVKDLIIEEGDKKYGNTKNIDK